MRQKVDPAAGHGANPDPGAEAVHPEVGHGTILGQIQPGQPARAALGAPGRQGQGREVRPGHGVHQGHREG